jgi:hypothetical protein
MNICKNRTFENLNKVKSTDYYFLYRLKRNERGKYLNTWFKLINQDNVIILVQNDKSTANYLYNRKFNPITISIINRYKTDMFDMKVSLNSIDDSSYSIWFENSDYNELNKIRTDIMKYISKHKQINGDDLLNYCVLAGADKESIDYN